MPWESEEIKPGDRVAQAGVVLAEQALLSDAFDFPKSASGKIRVPDASGRVEIDSPRDEFVSSKRQHDTDRTTPQGPVKFSENIDTITDASGKKIQTFDEQKAGFERNAVQANTINSKTIVRGADGALQFQLDGTSMASPRDGKFRDDTYIVHDGRGKLLPVQIHIVGQVTGPDSLSIKATTVSAEDRSGNHVAPHMAAQPRVLNSVEVKLKVDPGDPTGAKFQIQRNGIPLTEL